MHDQIESDQCYIATYNIECCHKVNITHMLKTSRVLLCYSSKTVYITDVKSLAYIQCNKCFTMASLSDSVV